MSGDTGAMIGSAIEYAVIAVIGLFMFFQYPRQVRKYNAKHPARQIELKPWLRYMGLLLCVGGIVRIIMVLV